MSKLRKNLVYILPIIMIGVIFGGFTLIQPANSIRMDVNPSIEIITNRLNRVVEIKPLNLDAERLLENFDLEDKSLEGTVNDLVDLMILTGYISGGKDNTVVLTVKDENADSKLVDKVNKAIEAMLENKQIEAKIIKQTIDDSLTERFFEDEEDDDDISEDRMPADIISKEQAERIALSKVDGQLMKTELGEDDKDIVSMATPQQPKQETKPSIQAPKQLIGEAMARTIALNLVKDGQIVELDLNDDEYEIEIIRNGIKYEIEINAYSGKVIEFESETNNIDDDDDEFLDDDRDDSEDYDDNDDDDDDDDDDDEDDDDDDDEGERD